MQSKFMSFVEAVVNVLIGCGVSMVANAIVFPLLGHHFTLVENIKITIIFTLISIARSYMLRRFFNRKSKCAS